MKNVAKNNPNVEKCGIYDRKGCSKVLFGGYDHSIDKKGRIAIPSKLRDILGTELVIAQSFTGKECICLYSKEEWQKVVDILISAPTTTTSEIKRFLGDATFNVEYDSQGRILIPPPLREFANLENEAHIIGVITNLEIWNKDAWEAEKKNTTLQSIASLAQSLGL